MTNSNWKSRAESMEDLVARVPNGSRVFVQGAAATPTPMLEALCARPGVEGMKFYHLHLEGKVPFAEDCDPKRMYSISLFTGAALRKPIASGRADFMPIFLSDIPAAFRERAIDLDVALVQLSPPDAHGYCTFGPSVDVTKQACQSARLTLAMINPAMPRTHGNSFIHISEVDAFTVVEDHPLHTHAGKPPSEIEQQIGEVVAELVEDGATLQMGIGAIPDAVLARLGNKKELGIHTEMFSDGLIPLVESGVVTNEHKKVHSGRVITSFAAGTRALFDYIDDNPMIEFHPSDRTNDTSLIRKNPKATAINSAIEIDLTGQVCADSIGYKIFSGIGGQMDFVHGAALSPGGKAIIALPSTAARGTVSRITSALKEGAGVVTTRGHVMYVATEYGVVNLRGKTISERGEALISIAHPDFRAELEKEFKNSRSFALAEFPPPKGRD